VGGSAGRMPNRTDDRNRVKPMAPATPSKTQRCHQ
jgi:hypothetical protein